MLSLYNTLTKKIEPFVPLGSPVSLYTCGPTVYSYAHIGNLRTYLFEDILKRSLTANGFKVKHVMNITDVGHLTSDADEGEDKMEKSALKAKKSVWDIAAMYTDAFKSNMRDLHILEPDIWCKATDHIEEQIAWIKKLEAKGFTYKTSDGVYFDTSKLPDYGKLTGQKLSDLKEGARVERNPEKHNPSDFALWKFSGAGQKRQMEWPSPWGMGFPGWHIECSVMAQKYLGETIDIHCGGIDHIPTHHTNEIAQVEAVTGKPFVRIWVHGEFLVVPSGKMAKSADNFITLDTLKEHGIHPLAYRYFALGAHYRSKLTFSWEALEGAQTAYDRLLHAVREYPAGGSIAEDIHKRFMEAANSDLNMPQALAIVWELVKSDISPADKKATLLSFDSILGLGLDVAPEKTSVLPDSLQRLLDERQHARDAKDFKRADDLRSQIEQLGYSVKDTPTGQQTKKSRKSSRAS